MWDNAKDSRSLDAIFEKNLHPVPRSALVIRYDLRISDSSHFVSGLLWQDPLLVGREVLDFELRDTRREWVGGLSGCRNERRVRQMSEARIRVWLGSVIAEYEIRKEFDRTKAIIEAMREELHNKKA